MPDSQVREYNLHSSLVFPLPMIFNIKPLMYHIATSLKLFFFQRGPRTCFCLQLQTSSPGLSLLLVKSAHVFTTPSKCLAYAPFILYTFIVGYTDTRKLHLCQQYLKEKNKIIKFER